MGEGGTAVQSGWYVSCEETQQRLRHQHRARLRFKPGFCLAGPCADCKSGPSGWPAVATARAQLNEDLNDSTKTLLAFAQ
eukprot:s2606_g9.t1